MNRKIAFRAWDTEKKQMHKDVFLESGAIAFIENMQPQSALVQLMQFTGLTDKNGVEVFEGDIIRRFNGIIATVVYEGTAYETHPIRGQRLHESDLRLDFDAVDKLEVIGNIYENPELLETK